MGKEKNKRLWPVVLFSTVVRERTRSEAVVYVVVLLDSNLLEVCCLLFFDFFGY